MSKRLAAGLALAAAAVVLPAPSASASPVCPPGWSEVRLTVPGTGINRLLACIPPYLEP